MFNLLLNDFNHLISQALSLSFSDQLINSYFYYWSVWYLVIQVTLREILDHLFGSVISVEKRWSSFILLCHLSSIITRL